MSGCREKVLNKNDFLVGSHAVKSLVVGASDQRHWRKMRAIEEDIALNEPCFLGTRACALSRTAELREDE
jgi:hypothetical protein